MRCVGSSLRRRACTLPWCRGSVVLDARMKPRQALSSIVACKLCSVECRLFLLMLIVTIATGGVRLWCATVVCARANTPSIEQDRKGPSKQANAKLLGRIIHRTIILTSPRSSNIIDAHSSTKVVQFYLETVLGQLHFFLSLFLSVHGPVFIYRCPKAPVQHQSLDYTFHQSTTTLLLSASTMQDHSDNYSSLAKKTPLFTFRGPVVV